MIISVSLCLCFYIDKNYGKIVYAKDDHFDIPEELLKLSHEELRARIAEERKKELEKKQKQLERLQKQVV